MQIRQPVVAGRFYPGQPEVLKKEVDGFLDKGSSPEETPWGFMLPHAGYIYCGEIIGKTIGKELLPSRLVILCPNHTGYGSMFSVWADGAWITPLGVVKVDSTLAREIIESGGNFEAEYTAHLREHSIEVLLPFLQEQTRDLSIVPICIATQNPAMLAVAGKCLGKVLKNNPDTGLIISSDMNHYENEKTTLLKDQLALDKIMASDPDGLLATVKNNAISMCGAAPMAMALYAAREMGKAMVELVAHETSGKASGDYEHTVGYAGMRIFIK